MRMIVPSHQGPPSPILPNHLLHLGADVPCLGPPQGVLVHQQSHELRHRYGGVGVIQLEGDLGREQVPVARVGLGVSPKYVLQVWT